MMRRGTPGTGSGTVAGEPGTVHPPISRRHFIRRAGLATAAMGLARYLEPVLVISPDILAGKGASFSRNVVRPDDMVVLNFTFHNLAIRTDQSGAFLRRAAPGAAYIVVGFPPQNILEEGFYEPAPGYEPSPGIQLDPLPPVQSRLALPSRLVFKFPDDVDEIPYELPKLLEWDDLDLRVAPVATKSFPKGRPPVPREPKELETAIEAPWRLIVSPNQKAYFENSTTPIDHDGWVELWHTRLNEHFGPTRTIGEQLPRLRAIWTPGFDHKVEPPQLDEPFRASLNQNDRWQLVKLTSDPRVRSQPIPALAERLMLTSLGAWMDVRGNWPETASLSLLHWTHRMTMARDHYVRVVRAGFLMPFGHKVALIKITERKFEKLKKGTLTGNVVAVLRQRFFIIVREPTRFFPDAHQPAGGRASPFKRVTLKTLITPNLDPQEDAPLGNGLNAKDAFWPRVANQDFLWHVEAVDHDGERCEFTMPMAYLEASIGNSTSLSHKVDKANKAYNSTANTDASPRRRAPTRGQGIAFAPSLKRGDTTLESHTLNFKTQDVSAGPQLAVKFFPILETAGVRLQAVEQTTGGQLGLKPVEIRFHSDYVGNGFKGANHAGVYAQLLDPPGLNFGGATDRSGALVTPNLSIGAISRKFGPMGGMAPFGQDDAPLPSQFKPEDFFEGASPQLLGVDNLLATIIKPVSFGSTDKVPQLKSELLFPGGDKTKPPIGNRTVLLWVPDLQPASKGNLFTDRGGASLKVVAITEVLFDKPQPSFTIDGDLRNFALNLFGTGAVGFITINFDRLRFLSENGAKPKVDVDIASVEFKGALEFIEKLKNYLKFGGSGPSLDVGPTGIEAGYTLAIPNVSVGVFTMQNMSFTAGLEIPFTGKPLRSRFAFCTRENPFLLTVSAFGGGGFVGMGLGLDGVELFELSLEFGASVALDIGVASGEVHVLGGVYIKVEQDPDHSNQENALLSGYVRMGGSLEIIGLITVSCEFKLELSYDSSDKSAYGQASLTVEVEVAFFSISVSMTVKRRLAGGGGGGSAKIAARTTARATAAGDNASGYSFEDFYPTQQTWDEYATAFAAYA